MKSILGFLIIMSSTAFAATSTIKSQTKTEEASKSGYTTLDMSEFRKLDEAVGPKREFISKTTCTAGGVTYDSYDAGYSTCLNNLENGKNSRGSQGQRRENQPQTSLEFSTQQK